MVLCHRGCSLRSQSAVCPEAVALGGGGLFSAVTLSCFTGAPGSKWELGIPWLGLALLGLAEALASSAAHTCLAVRAKPVHGLLLGNSLGTAAAAGLSWGSRGLLALPKALSGLSEPLGVL